MNTADSKAEKYHGQVVYMFAYDLAYEMAGGRVKTLLGEPLAEFSVDLSRRSPRHLFFYRPQMVRLPPAERLGPGGPVRVETTVKLLALGAVSITVRVPFSVAQISDLVDYHDVQFSNGTLHAEVRRLAEKIRAELRPWLIRPVEQLAEEEAYTVFCIQGPLVKPEGGVVNAQEWLGRHQRAVAGLLTQEPDPMELSEQEAQESTGRFLSYYGDDILVMDWDAALMIDAPEDFDESLYVMELTNLQLAELEAYDRLLDDALERAYRDLRSSPIRRRRGDVMNDLRDLRIDLARMSDEMSNITKFFGDWHLARIYASMAGRFHLAEWHRAIDEKSKTLNDLYQILKSDQNNRWMLILEVTIVILFVVDLIVLFFGPHR